MKLLALCFIFCLSLSKVKTMSENDLKKLDEYTKTIARQIMLQQFFTEQRVRSEGQSGLNIQRQRRAGTKNYFVESHTGYAAAAIHDHANNIRTVGMGEFTAVLNGLQFTTRHNDYRLYMSHRTSKNYHAVEPIPFPSVPQAVLNKPTIKEQIEEMRQWFKAWRDQDDSKRDYKKHFKPILCYLEGAWTQAERDVDEPFSSDRHFIDAKTWMELHEKLMFTSYSGAKSIRENLSYLPTKIMEMINDTIPVFSQWNYRILCHPLKKDVPFSRLRVVEDLSSRMMTERNIYRHLHSRGARFQLNSKNQNKFHDRPLSYEFLDELMEEIPGKDNYQGKLYDEGLEAEVLNFDKTKKDVSRYHRWYKTEARDAMGTTNIHRGYNDNMFFAAMTTQPKVASLSVKKCKNPRWPKTCKKIRQKWTYAIPLELIYLTPLSSWNPYKLPYFGNHNSKSPVIANERKGNCNDPNLAYNGTNSKFYYITPSEFYHGDHGGKTSADTAKGTVCVVDKMGKSHYVRAAGTHVFLPNIKDVGVMRQRYPIFPVHGEGSSVWKELNALREIVMDEKRWGYMKWNYNNIHKQEGDSGIVELVMGASQSSVVTQHTHTVEMSHSEILQCKGGADIYKTSSTANGHEHDLKIRYDPRNQVFYYVTCGGLNLCRDKHVKRFAVVENDDEATV